MDEKERICETAMEYVVLNNGEKCPVVGLGTFMLTPAEAENSVREALKMGCSLVDTANAYMNERAVGRGMRESGVSREECARLARGLAKRMFEELGIPCYCYEAAAFSPERRNLAVCRAGEYESLREKMADPARRPDFCGSWDERAARSGASVVGARNFLIAVNFNLDTKDAALASEVAMDVREKGRKLPDGSWLRGPLKGCKAIGWYIEEYGIAQVSMNVTDIAATPLHVAYETVCRAASARGLRVTGTEIIGLVPRQVLLDAGRYFLQKPDAGEEELVQAAVRGMALDDLCPFDPHRKVIEYQL